MRYNANLLLNPSIMRIKLIQHKIPNSNFWMHSVEDTVCENISSKKWLLLRLGLQVLLMCSIMTSEVVHCVIKQICVFKLLTHNLRFLEKCL